MKKLILAGLLLVSSTSVWAVTEATEAINISSFTKSADSFVTISSYPGTELFGIAVATPSTGGSLVLLDGQTSFVANASTIASVSLATVQNQIFEIRVSSGLMYNLTGPNNGVTIIWRPRNPKDPAVNTVR